MSENDTRHDSTVSGNNNSDCGSIHVPAQAQRELGIAIDDVVSVTLMDLDHEYIDSITFEGTQIGGDTITVPAHIMRDVGIEGGESVTATFDLPDDESDDVESDEAEASELGQSQGSIESEETESEETESEEEPGLGELFG